MIPLIQCALVLSLATGFARIQTAEGCSACGGSGRVACAEHSTVDVSPEQNALLCTFYAGCERCAGAGT